MTRSQSKLIDIQLDIVLWARKNAIDKQHEIEDIIHKIVKSFGTDKSKIKKLEKLYQKLTGKEYIQEEYDLNEYTNQKELNPEIWSDFTMHDTVRESLLKIARIFWQEFDVPYSYTDITLTGSSANYNWTDFSDIDLHLIVDFNSVENPLEFQKYANTFKSKWNSEHDLKIGNHFIELYIQDSNEPHTSTGVYSLLYNKWIKEPEYTEIVIDDKLIDDKVEPFIREIDAMERTGLDIDKINNLRERIRQFRKTGLQNDGEYSVENLAFKKLRNDGYLAKLSQMRIQAMDSYLLNSK